MCSRWRQCWADIQLSTSSFNVTSFGAFSQYSLTPPPRVMSAFQVGRILKTMTTLTPTFHSKVRSILVGLRYSTRSRCKYGMDIHLIWIWIGLIYILFCMFLGYLKLQGRRIQTAYYYFYNPPFARWDITQLWLITY